MRVNVTLYSLKLPLKRFGDKRVTRLGKTTGVSPLQKVLRGLKQSEVKGLEPHPAKSTIELVPFSFTTSTSR